MVEMPNSKRLFMLVLALIVTAASLTFAGQDKTFSYDNYAETLGSYVDANGMVNYEKLKENRQKLDKFVTHLAKLDTKVYDKWDDNTKIAFWLNAYNALTLKAIIDNYPIKPAFLMSAAYPKNSIRQIPGVWKKIKFDVTGKKMSLNHIEHKILRKNFAEPRIHMAMVCAAMSCPALRNEPFAGKKLDTQLSDQSKRFFANQENFKIDRENNTVYISPILKWFAKDFAVLDSGEAPLSHHSKTKSSVLKFISLHVEKKDAKYLLAKKFKIKYLKYDWTLNEQSKNE
ncbi:MAG: DUF547 domain-containing protein [Planctomycetes bacterium]|nr:DUF547 domain-containing protein [Planctomycetota bacterium]